MLATMTHMLCGEILGRTGRISHGAIHLMRQDRSFNLAVSCGGIQNLRIEVRHGALVTESVLVVLLMAAVRLCPTLVK
jgi:hypothetical protein